MILGFNTRIMMADAPNNIAVFICLMNIIRSDYLLYNVEMKNFMHSQMTMRQGKIINLTLPI